MHLLYFFKQNSHLKCTFICKKHHAKKLNTQESPKSTYKLHSNAKLLTHKIIISNQCFVTKIKQYVKN